MDQGLETSRRLVSALTTPRNVVIVGASDRHGSWAERVWHNLERCGFAGAVYPMNPGRAEIWGVRCYADFRDLPEPPDHLVVLIPAAGVANTLRAAATAGARSATVFSSGFGEAEDVQGMVHRRALAAAIADTGLAVSGPNCMGNICAPGRLATLTEIRHASLAPGPVAMVGQSGGVMIFTQWVLEERGHGVGYVITSGNEVGLSLADYIAFFAAEPDVKIILCYVEAIANLARFKAACRAAREAGKYVIVHKLGQSDAGRAAAMAHTGSLAGSAAAFDAVADDLGVMRVSSLDDAVELVEYLTHARAPAGRRLGAITLSGAYRGLLLDAAAANNLSFPPLTAATDQKLRSLLSVGSLVSNPLDGGYGVLASRETYLHCVEALDHDPNIDMLLLQEELPRGPGADRTESYLRGVEHYVSARAQKPVVFVSVLSHGHNDYSRALRAELPHLAFLNESGKALRAIDRVVRRAERLHIADGAVRVPAPDAAAIAALRGKATDKAVMLGEAESKALLRLYGVATPREALATSRAQAMREAAAIGFPVVLKAVSDAIPHKSEVGAVMLGLKSEDDVALAWERIQRNLREHGIDAVSAMLVAQQIDGGVELALGLHRDPEMGPVVMAGAGGRLVELVKDVAFAAPPLDVAKARDLLQRTRAAQLLAGFRGAPRCDVEAAAAALVALGCIALDLGDVVEAIDINPFVALPEGKGGLALDALIVLRRASAAG